MRIVFVSPRAWPAIGGMELYLRHLTRALASEHAVTVLTQGIDTGTRSEVAESVFPPAGFEEFVDDGVHVRHLRIPPGRRLAMAPLVSQVVPGLRRHAWGRARFVAARVHTRNVAPLIRDVAAGCDVVHVWGTGLLGATAVHAARTLAVPCVITPFAHRGQWGDDGLSAATYRRADRVVALLGSDARLYRQLGVAPERIRVCGVCSPGETAGGGEELRRRRGIDGPLVLFLGRRTAYKGADLLLEAAPALPDVTFAFAGPGDAVVAPAGARVVDAGAVDDAERAAWLDAADVLALPSAAEILPVSILEAWSVGTPVLVSEIETLRELVRDGGGTAVPRESRAIADALRALLSDRAALRASGEAGRTRWRDEYSVEAVARAHAELYGELLARAEVACVA